jgi:methyl-accepting chemotaxis protein
MTERIARGEAQAFNDVASFSSEIEATLAELGRIPDHMLDASGKLASVAQDASAKMSRAEAASAASQNVRDIASAADELFASVNEIDRQVTQARQRRKPRAALKLRRDARRKRRVKSGWSVRRRRTRARARGP